MKGRREGYWTWRFANGGGADGQYVNGKPHGEWTFRYTNGKKEDVRYEHGVEIRNRKCWHK